jgi:hypothetical protein
MDLDVDALKAKLATLKDEHRYLDDAIGRIAVRAPIDQLELQRLKKRKLLLKDEIGKIESGLDEGVTQAVVRPEQIREELIALVYRFAADGLSWTAEEAAKITGPTRQTAEAFLRALPVDKASPKISPDGEGGLMMVWEDNDHPLLVTVDDMRLHVVVAAATPFAEYVDDIPFGRGQEIPERVLNAIPARHENFGVIPAR